MKSLWLRDFPVQKSVLKGTHSGPTEKVGQKNHGHPWIEILDYATVKDMFFESEFCSFLRKSHLYWTRYYWNIYSVVLSGDKEVECKYRKSSNTSRPLIQVASIRGRTIGGPAQALIGSFWTVWSKKFSSRINIYWNTSNISLGNLGFKIIQGRLLIENLR